MSVLAGITSLANQLTRRALERELLLSASEVAETVGRRLEASALEVRILEQVLIDHVNSNPEIDAIAVFERSSTGEMVKVASAGTIMELDPEHRAAPEERRPVSRQIDRHGERFWSVVVPICPAERCTGAVGVLSSLRASELLVRQNRLRAFIAAPLSVAIIVVIMHLVFRHLVRRPLREIETAMARAEAGDMKGEARVVRDDELGLIASRYNAMLARIRAVMEEHQELRRRVERFNEELTDEIARATRELRDKNREMQRLQEESYYLQRRLARFDRRSAAHHVAERLAHRIGTPLNLVSGHVQMVLEMSADDSVLKDKLQIVQTQIEKLTTVVRDVLDETRKPTMQFETVDLDPMLDRLVVLVEPALTRLGVKIERKGVGSRSATIAGDETQLEQAFYSLLNNSIDAMPNGGRITVELDQSSERVRVRFSDTGEGIPPNVLSQMFRPFFTTKEAGRGTGLGLTIVKEILDSHGATIHAESELGKGTTFTLEFPPAAGAEMEVSSVDAHPDRG